MSRTKKPEVTSKDKWVSFEKLRVKNDFRNADFISLRNEIATENYHLVIKLSDIMHRKHQDIDKEDLRSFASLGLLDAIMRYDSSKDIKFETFATYRLFGSMYDEMRKSDWLPRLTRQRMIKTEKAREKFITINGMRPTQAEIINMAKAKDVNDITKLLNENGEIKIYSMNAPSTSFADEEMGCFYVEPKGDKTKEVIKMDFFNNYIRKVFDEKDSKIIWLVYYENRTLKDTANILGIRESRICPIHSNLLKKLRKLFIENPHDLEVFKFQ